jgi:NAD(P)-dependent dehydrogenase (short-subunit alcohol dehydrogenase family)
MPEATEESTTAPAAAETPATETTTTTETPPAQTNGTADSADDKKADAPADAETKTEAAAVATETKEGEEETKTDEKPTAEEEAKSKMTGRVMIVTGASSGLGFAVANYLCEGGNDVILACRSEEKANRSIERIKQKNPNALATYMNLDLASMESVRKFADDFHALEKPLHVLVNNAGVAMSPKDPKRQYTADNFEMTIGTNHFGPFLLTNLLLEDLKKSSEGEGGDARIINVASSVHDPESMKRRNKQFRDLQPMDIDNILLLTKAHTPASRPTRTPRPPTSCSHTSSRADSREPTSPPTLSAQASSRART